MDEAAPGLDGKMLAIVAMTMLFHVLFGGLLLRLVVRLLLKFSPPYWRCVAVTALALALMVGASFLATQQMQGDLMGAAAQGAILAVQLGVGLLATMALTMQMLRRPDGGDIGAWPALLVAALGLPLAMMATLLVPSLAVFGFLYLSGPRA